MSELSQEVLDNARSFIANINEQNKSLANQTQNELEKAQQIFHAYSEASRDFIESRLKYLEYIEKYEAGSKTVLPSIFPGVTDPQHINTDGMVQDSEAMKQLANVIRQLEEQLEVLKFSLLDSVKRVYLNTDKVFKDDVRINSYLDEVITGLDSAYDIGLFGSSFQ